jgi:NADH-quinone oxidoreductase subunit C
MTAEDVLQKLTGQLGPAATDAAVAGPEVRLTVPAEAGWQAARLLRDLGFEYLNCLSGVDWTSHLEVVLDVSSLSHPLKAHLRVRLNREEPVIRTFTEIWPAANWHERECFDLLGVDRKSVV